MLPEIRPSSPTPNLTAATPSAASRPEATVAPAALPADRAEIRTSRPSALEMLRADVASEAASLEKKLPAHRAGEVLVVLKKGTSEKSFKSLTSGLGLDVVKKFNIPKAMEASMPGEMYLLKSSQLRTSESMAMLGRSPHVVYAASNDELHLIEPTEKHEVDLGAAASAAPRAEGEVVPNDLDSRLWGLRNQGQDGGTAGADIDATQAWNITTGRHDAPIVAVIDTGIDYTHPELANNMWTNPDPNAPDRHGYNFAENRPDPMDDHSHGTHCSGTIAGEGNNGQGVVGVNWRAQLMGLKFLTASGSGSTADAVEAVMYATEHGARITSNSWGGGGFNQALYDVLKASPALHIFAAGNAKNDNDASPSYPASYNLDNIVAVAASDRNDQKASFSNYGRTSVDLAAPGKDILSTVPGNKYASYSGTSMATPHVAGAASLIASQYPDITNEQLKARLLNSVDKLSNWSDKVATGGRLNLLNALEPDSTAPECVCDLRGYATGSTQATLTWTASGDDGTAGTASSYDLRWSDTPITAEGGDGSVSFENAQSIATGAPQASGMAETASFRVTPSATERTVYVAMRVTDNVGNASAIATTEVTIPAANVAFEGNQASSFRAEAPWSQVSDDKGTYWSSAPAGPQGNNANVSLTSRTIDLTSVKGSSLTFAASYALESGYDFARVEVSENGGKSWQELSKVTGESDWSSQALDLSAFDGKQVQVRFRVSTDASQESAGLKLKNVMVSGDRA